MTPKPFLQKYNQPWTQLYVFLIRTVCMSNINSYWLLWGKPGSLLKPVVHIISCVESNLLSFGLLCYFCPGSHKNQHFDYKRISNQQAVNQISLKRNLFHNKNYSFAERSTLPAIQLKGCQRFLSGKKRLLHTWRSTAHAASEQITSQPGTTRTFKTKKSSKAVV